MLQNIFNLLKGKEQPFALANYTLMAVDLHSHLIPNIDDGVRTLEESLDIIRQFAQLGFKKIITTPHIMADGYNNTPEIILRGRDKVREALQAFDINVQFDAAAEYYLDSTMYEKIEKKELLTLAKDFLLVEIPLNSRLNNLDDLNYKLQVAGYNVILAHPERYPYYHHKNFDDYNSLKDRGIFFQVNLFSLIGKYGTRVKAVAEKLIDENMVDFIGTDLHGSRHMPLVKQCLKEKYVEKILTSDKLLNKTLL